MRNYRVRTKVQTITTNTILVNEEFGGWQCVNQGDRDVTVNGILLAAGSNIIGLDFTNLDPSVIWDDNINITFGTNGTTPQLLIVRLKYTQK